MGVAFVDQDDSGAVAGAGRFGDHSEQGKRPEVDRPFEDGRPAGASGHDGGFALWGGNADRRASIVSDSQRATRSIVSKGVSWSWESSRSS